MLEALAWARRQALTRRAVVVGGGAAGMTAALALAGLGIPVDLVEREGELGGQWRHIRYQADGSDPQAALQALIAQVEAEGRITIHTGAELTGAGGGPGSYRSAIAQDGDEQTIEHGVLVVATGGKPAVTEEYLYGQDPRVLTQRELEQQVAEGTLARAQTVVMIQCVGSREGPAALLQPGVLHAGGQERAQAEGTATRPEGLRPVPRGADLRLSRSVLPGGPRRGRGVPALRAARTSPECRPMGRGWRSVSASR